MTVEVHTAWHEAGHAVMAMIFDRPVHRVSILPDDERLGHCQVNKGVYRPSDDRLEADLLILLAGPAAEAEVAGRYNWGGAALDLRGVHRLAMMRGGAQKQAERLARRMLSRAEHLLRQKAHWHAVELIARELLSHQVISGRAARHLFDTALRKFSD
jgi:hypothetical protein